MVYVTLKDGTKIPVESRRSVSDIIQKKSTAQRPLVNLDYDEWGRIILLGEQRTCPFPGCGVALAPNSYFCDRHYDMTAGMERFVLYYNRDSLTGTWLLNRIH